MDSAIRWSLKILSPDISHKSDVGGVALDLARHAVRCGDDDETRARSVTAGSRMRVRGQTMVRRPRAFELIVGAATTRYSVPSSCSVRVAPVDRSRTRCAAPAQSHLARDLIARTRVLKQLAGYRGVRPSTSTPSHLMCCASPSCSPTSRKWPSSTSIHCLPMSTARRPRCAHARRPATDRRTTLRHPALPERPGGTGCIATARLLMRPIRPEDEPAFRAAFGMPTPEDIRMRFFLAIILPHPLPRDSRRSTTTARWRWR